MTIYSSSLSQYYSNPCSSGVWRVLTPVPHDTKRHLYYILKKDHIKAALGLRYCASGSPDFDMDMFLQTKSIFLHIPKAAGRSIQKTIYSGHTCTHTTAYWYSLALTRSELNKFYAYTIVRNPWSRIHSAYYFLKEGGAHQGDALAWKRYLSQYADFKSFVLDIPSSPEALFMIVHFFPMHHFIELGLNVNFLKYVGYYEDIGKAYRTIVSQIQQNYALEGAPLAHVGITRSKSRKYSDEYSKKMIEIVGELYSRDIELFGYTYDSFSRDKAKIRLGRYLGANAMIAGQEMSSTRRQ